MNRQISLLKKLLISTKDDAHGIMFHLKFSKKIFTCLEALQSAEDTNPYIA
jgi:hypothetical protein